MKVIIHNDDDSKNKKVYPEILDVIKAYYEEL